MPNEGDFQGPTGDLAAIGVALKKYATAKPEDHEKLASKIRTQALQLQAKLSAVKELE